MSRSTRRLTSIVAALALLLTALAVASTAATATTHEEQADPRFRALVFSKVTNFYHQSIPAGQAAIEQLGAENDFEVVTTDDATIFNDEDLATFDVVIFNNTNSTPESGDLLNADQRAAFQRYIQAGGGFTGLHAATAAERDWEWYEDLVGSIFTNHPPGTNPDGTINGRVKVTDRVHPSTANLPELWEFEEEWYNWNQRVVGDVHVLTWVDTKVGISGLTEGPNHPFSWCQIYDGGRSWYTAGGHSAAAFQDADFVEHLKGGIEWAAGVADGDCGGTAEESFDKVQIASNPADPMALGFLNENEVVFVERGGAVKIIDQTTLGVTTAGTVPVYTPDSDGLLGIAVDPDFATNRWIYLTYSHAIQPRIQISRFTLTDQNQLDLASEEVLIEIPTYRQLNRSGVHMGGAMDFDAAGNLYVALGDNIDPFESSGYAPIDERSGRAHFDAQSTSANTADLRGKLIRITPTDDGGYTVPDGNLFDAETHDPAEARPEIYAMGFRNPFRFRVDDATGHVLLGEHSPDARSNSATRGPQAHGEWNLITEAGNYGWPYCIGPNRPFHDYDYATATAGAPFDCANPVNDSPNNTGLRELPPITGATMFENYGATPEWPEFGTGGIAPHGGPIYDYDPELDSDTKFPPSYDGKWFISEWDRRWIKTVSVLSEDHTGERYPSAQAGDVYSVDPWGIDQTWIRPMDMDFGPDGSLYVIEWGSNFGGALRGEPNDDSGIYRIDYVAGDRPPTARAAATPSDGQAPLTVQFASTGSGHPQGLPVTYAWDFGDGGSSTEPDPSHVYTANGTYTARLTVTDEEGREALAAVQVVVGNTRPVVTVELPPDGGFFDFGDLIPYEVSVEDAEDGSIADGGIDCADVLVQTLLGHDEHAHPLDTVEGCEGVVPTMTDGGHGGDVNLYYVLEGVYVDRGGEGVGTLTGASGVELRTKSTEAEYYDGNSGVTPLARPGSSAGVRLGEIRPGDWVSYDPVSFHGIDSVTVGASSAGQGGVIEFRKDAPDGEVLGSVEVLSNGSWDTVQELEVGLADPGGTFELFMVFQARDGYTPGGPDLLSADWLRFNGPGVADPDAPVVTASASPESGQAPLEVTFTGSATSPAGREIVSYAWDFGDGGSGSGASATHTYTTPGSYDAVLTATDSAGSVGRAHVAVEVEEPPSQCPVRDDEFDGTALDTCRWSRIVREAAGDYRVADGRLWVHTTSGGNFGANNNPPVQNQFLQPVDPDEDWLIQTKVHAPLEQRYQQVGLQYYEDDGDYVKLDLVADNLPGQPRTMRVELRSETGDVPSTTQPNLQPAPANPGDEWWFRLQKSGTTFTGWISVDGVTWIEMPGSVQNTGITDGGFGPLHQGRGQTEPVEVGFDHFRVNPEDEPAACPEPDERDTVVVGGLDSGVPNRALADGCTVGDLILDDEDWASHAEFVRHVGEVLDQPEVAALITPRERSAILRAAAGSDVGSA
ncbi:ThuA domain-containing protein [Jiangella mangrovi]|uniref:PKD repeat protein/type 1 glutamine amidotransferase n=1 Tax=Jiangella mangrovi TaxID=1524084 RepID=A0A7W9LJB4_9ACTN|nr:ThuA domain-containing protein [Jiangella mangrovi]MBB5785863.1 PKD repeat protein/type 1 glutamine amidotransferase [Jiangella mangrovi]